MKRSAFVKYLRSQRCELLREGGNHSWWWNPDQNKRSSIPRHTEIDDVLMVKICKDLGVKPIK
ncbi:type II toxin-antitoxin system HicA family toxin [Thiospirillum jenense]|uniref:Type II toxin-antitoxin system HicA family toxin n=1 Tax=Thiospirillum jenense TaxID=1653858 RepID=A0A839H9C2_9GAMM|nr:type II toxin-antitoxin system HicA family toxin [Thiospirillum jenense]MBB1125913.1 type II toxin-antitoxin system HicA family toxin [Thiospirillum jenense]